MVCAHTHTRNIIIYTYVLYIIINMQYYAHWLYNIWIICVCVCVCVYAWTVIISSRLLKGSEETTRTCTMSCARANLKSLENNVTLCYPWMVWIGRKWSWSIELNPLRYPWPGTQVCLLLSVGPKARQLGSKSWDVVGVLYLVCWHWQWAQN